MPNLNIIIIDQPNLIPSGIIKILLFIYLNLTSNQAQERINFSLSLTRECDTFPFEESPALLLYSK